MVKLLIKKLDKNIILPEYKTKGSSGMDLTANIKESILLSAGKITIIPTGIAVSIPLGHELQIRPRSGLAAKNGISILNTPGTIDADYRGEVKVILINLGGEDFQIKPNDRIAQMVLCPVLKADLEIVEDLPNTIRGKGGFGSTGK